MKRNILHALICILLIGCTSNNSDTIIVYYLQSLIDTSIPKSCSVMKKSAMSDRISPFIRYDTICIQHSDFVKLKEFISNQNIVHDTINRFCIDSRIVAVYDTLAVSFGETENMYGLNQNDKIVYANNEIIYLLKSLSGYYNHFDKEDLLSFFPEIKEFGIPKTYKRAEYPKMTIKNGIVKKNFPILQSKIILVDSI